MTSCRLLGNKKMVAIGYRPCQNEGCRNNHLKWNRVVLNNEPSINFPDKPTSSNPKQSADDGEGSIYFGDNEVVVVGDVSSSGGGDDILSAEANSNHKYFMLPKSFIHKEYLSSPKLASDMNKKRNDGMATTEAISSVEKLNEEMMKKLKDGGVDGEYEDVVLSYNNMHPPLHNDNNNNDDDDDEDDEGVHLKDDRLKMKILMKRFSSTSECIQHCLTNDTKITLFRCQHICQ
ncbi:hypothetical protein HELRODRAFT_165204 [Helobdella robusta]|uniref:Uncharacterized protein n=1 Tax=Helobdella robusta TaxID=6412 RepID=T1EWF4_HELRO|nr:hypothetical protein HELRODRAFT_165204 [Helobdella robusta]ESN93047.1 hypothetical protein HELRODRAFT_165204 [Helobdella robusta]